MSLTFTSADIDHHRQASRMGPNAVHGAPWFVKSWKVTNSGHSLGKVLASFAQCGCCGVSMAETEFNGQCTEDEAIADVIEKVSDWFDQQACGRDASRGII